MQLGYLVPSSSSFYSFPGIQRPQSSQVTHTDGMESLWSAQTALKKLKKHEFWVEKHSNDPGQTTLYLAPRVFTRFPASKDLKALK